MQEWTALSSTLRAPCNLLTHLLSLHALFVLPTLTPHNHSSLTPTLPPSSLPLTHFHPSPSLLTHPHSHPSPSPLTHSHPSPSPPHSLPLLPPHTSLTPTYHCHHGKALVEEPILVLVPFEDPEPALWPHFSPNGLDLLTVKVLLRRTLTGFAVIILEWAGRGEGRGGI